MCFSKSPPLGKHPTNSQRDRKKERGCQQEVMRCQHDPHECDTKGQIAGAADIPESGSDQADRDQPADVPKSNCEKDKGVVRRESLRHLKAATEEAAFSVRQQASLQKECS